MTKRKSEPNAARRRVDTPVLCSVPGAAPASLHAFLVVLLVLSVAIQSPGQTADKSSSTSSMQQHYNAAVRFQSSGDTTHAAEQYRLFITEALDDLGRDRAHIGQYARAKTLFDEALTLSPGDSALLQDSAEAALQARDFSSAAKLAQQAVDRNGSGASGPTAAKAHLLLGQALLGMNENRRARQQFESAVALDPNFEDGYALATADLALADKKDAARVFREMQAGLGDTAALHMQFGLAYGNAEDPEEAIQEFRKTLAKDEKFPDAHYSLGASYLLRSGDTDFPQAEAEFHKELAFHPDDYFSYSELGYIAMARHRLPAAIHDLTRAASLNPQDPDNFLLLGQIYAEVGQPANAEKALRSAIALTNDPSRNHYQIRGAHYQLGRLLIERGDLAEGKKEMQVSEELLLENKQRDKANVLGQRFAQISSPNTTARKVDPAAEAEVDTLEKKLGPAIADSYNDLGVIAAMGNDSSDAVTYFANAHAWNPGMEGLDYNWGRAAVAARLYAQAVGPLGRYVQAHPEDAGARSTLGVADYMVHDYRGTLRVLDPIADHVGTVPMLAFVYAESMVQAGDLKRGIERLKILQQAHPKSASIEAALADAYRKNTDGPNQAHRTCPQSGARQNAAIACQP